MRNTRLIARLDIKGKNLIKGINLEGLRVIGDPYTYAKEYYEEGIDELLYIDAVASLYGRNSINDVIEHTAMDVFIPLTIGGGIRSVSDAVKILRCGADKVAINTAAIKNPSLITDIAQNFGSQCMVLSVQAKKVSSEKWQAFVNNGRETSDLDVVEWVKHAVKLGAGEILITSIDQEGTRKGFDINLIKAVTDVVSVPVIASGGMGKCQDLVDVVTEGQADAVAMADILHYKRKTVSQIRFYALEKGLNIRKV